MGSKENSNPWIKSTLTEKIQPTSEAQKFITGIEKAVKNLVKTHYPKLGLKNLAKGVGDGVWNWLNGDMRSYVIGLAKQNTCTKQYSPAKKVFPIHSWDYTESCFVGSVEGIWGTLMRRVSMGSRNQGPLTWLCLLLCSFRFQYCIQNKMSTQAAVMISSIKSHVFWEKQRITHETSSCYIHIPIDAFD